MQYNGGKASCAKDIASLIASDAPAWAKTYWEPFCGACNILLRPELTHFTRLGSDLDEYITALLNAVAGGWQPPESISEEQYLWAKCGADISTYLRGFIGYGCSFGGKWFGGYARSGQRNYAANARNSLLKCAKELYTVAPLVSCPYWDEPFGSCDIIYCDPPYAGATPAGSGRTFDTAKLWEWVADKALEGSVVYVSEFSAPIWAKEVWHKEIKDGLRRKDGSSMVERLFKVSVV